MAEYLGLSMSTMKRHCNKGFFKDALSMFDKKTCILDAERVLEIMRASENEWIKKAVEKFDNHHKKED